MSFHLYSFIGSDVYSTFRVQKINQTLAKRKDPVGLEKASQYFVVEASQELSKQHLSIIENLLGAQRHAHSWQASNHLVLPRQGTISPWSTKATDIVHHCGLTDVTRVETGRLLTISGSGNFPAEDLLDRMTEAVYSSAEDFNGLFDHHEPQPVKHIDIRSAGIEALQSLNKTMGLALSDEEINYLYNSYTELDQLPTDVELMMFAQANSEHCRHKIFNANWHINQKAQTHSLFQMIRNTEACTSQPALSAYKDNAAVFSGGQGQRLISDHGAQYQPETQDIDVLIKVETHNHPTAIEPFAGAATGSGGEIRDEAATGQGAKPKAGLCGFSVSHLHIPGFEQPWETASPGTPERMATAFEIMQKGPIGAAAFNNEFGRPNICGYFRNFEHQTQELNSWRGYHKPIMLAGGMGHINHIHTEKQDTQAGDYVVVLGGPAMLIGLGGGAASSISSADGQEDLDFASVQRGNPEMQRRCQEVIDRCWYQKTDSPIRSIHDVGAGGLSNAIPEILDDASLGGEIELRRLQIDHVFMSPMEIWCNESQERYVLSIKPEKLDVFKALCARERCPYAIMGQATAEQTLKVNDELFGNSPVNVPMDLLFGNTPRTEINIELAAPSTEPYREQVKELKAQVEQVLSFPSVASKKYLITIGDRTVSGLIHRDQMVGPWQVPVADCGITLRDYQGYAGEAMAVGERTPVALLNPAASARLAVAEAITNLAGVGLAQLSDIKLSANWMAASSHPGEYQALFEAVKTVGMELCPQLDIGIPVGKDSMSMQTRWSDQGVDKTVTAPMSLIISAFAAVKDVRQHLTPQLSGQADGGLWLIDLSAGRNRMGGSVLYQVQQQMGETPADLDDPQALNNVYAFMHEAIQHNLLAACHDKSDGGLMATLAEMAFAGHCGLRIKASESLATDHLRDWLFNEEPGLVIEPKAGQAGAVQELLERHGLRHLASQVANIQADAAITIETDSADLTWSLGELEQVWAAASHHMARHRDHPESVDQEHALIVAANPGMQPEVDFEHTDVLLAPYVNTRKPKMAILREQGVNGQNEMAMAFMRAGFDCYDVHMQDLIDGRFALQDFNGLAACGGFSYGDVLGAGQGWAKSIIYNDALKASFSQFFADTNKFALGVCNGCQMLSALRSIIPGTDQWPDFVRNRSEQFEARYSQLRIADSNNLFFTGMAGALIPVAIAHGEGRAAFASNESAETVLAAQYADNQGQPTQLYPMNPNGSTSAVAAVTNEAGNVLAMMPHPERVFRTVQMSWAPEHWGEDSPWMRMFYNARLFVN